MNLQKIYDYFFSNNYMTKMPSFGEVLASNVITLFLLLIILGLYIAGKVLLMKKIYGEKKMWQGAIPVLGLMKLYDAIELNKLFAISILIPVLGLIPYFIFCYKLPAAFGEKQPAFPYLTIFFSPIIMLMLATDQKYEYQYVRGKNIPFQGAFALNNTQVPTGAPAQPVSEIPVQSTQGIPIESQNPSISENQVQSSGLNNLQ